MPTRLAYASRVRFGMDPELFISTPEGGVVEAKDCLGDEEHKRTYGWKRDGVQVEINVSPDYCRETIGGELVYYFRSLRKHLEKKGQKVNFTSLITLSPEEMGRLSEDAKKLGCEPSRNLYGRGGCKVDGGVYRKRSASGHIHLSAPVLYKVEPERFVRVMDILMGNTCVLLDRGKGARERRKVYGKAGEFRVPAMGRLEYRTLSNFWLRSYPLTSFVLGLTRLCVSVVEYSQPKPTVMLRAGTPCPPSTAFSDFESDLISRVDLEMVERAINTNSLRLAQRTWKKVREWVGERLSDEVYNRRPVLSPNMLEAFDFFRGRSMKKWWPDDPMTHWCGLDDLCDESGWNDFIAGVDVERKREWRKKSTRR